MGRLIISNNDRWIKALEESQRVAGMKLNTSVSEPVSLLCYYKYRLENENFYQESNSSDFIATSGSLIYKNQFGVLALKELLSDYKKQGLKSIRKNLMGNFCVAVGANGQIDVFVDETGTYSVYYYADPESEDFLITNTFYHVQKCAKQKIKGFEFLENVTIPSIFDNQSPFDHILRLGGDEIITIANNQFAVAKVEVNTYALEAEDFDHVSAQIAAAILRYTKTATAIPYERLLFLTGGVDSRLLLSAHLAANSKISVGNWQGAPVDMNSKNEDGLISKKLAEKCGIDFQSFDVSHDILNELHDSPDEIYERYGEYVSIYGNNRKWFEIFEKGSHSYWDFGHLGEMLRDVEELEEAYHEGISLKEYYSKHLRQQCADFSFIGSKETTPNGLDDTIYNKFFDYCQKVGIDTNNLKKRDCYKLHNVAMLHSEMIKANMYNIIGYYTNVYSQKEVFDLGISFDATYRKGKKLIVSMIEKMWPSLNEIDYFTRCRFMKYDSENKSLSETKSAKVKSVLKEFLNKTSLGTALLASRRKNIDKARANESADLISRCTELINESNIMQTIGARVDDNTFTYFPNYAIFLRSCEYMDRLIDQES